MPVKIPQLVEPATGLTGTMEVWTAEVVLPDNVDAVFRYKFIVDGDWCYDAAQPTLANPHGSYDNYVTVSLTICCLVVILEQLIKEFYLPPFSLTCLNLHRVSKFELIKKLAYE